MTCFYADVNIFTNNMIKTPGFIVSASLQKSKIRKEFIKRVSVTKQKVIVISFW